MMEVIDTRDLLEEREASLEELIDFLHNRYGIEIEELEDLEKLENFQKKKYEEDKEILELIEIIREINIIEKEVGNEFQYGEQLIRKDYFEGYAKELVEDCGYITKDLPWWIEIDWSKTAENLKDDYVDTIFRGFTYYYKA